MKRKCNRSDWLFTQDNDSTWSPIPLGEIFKYTKYCVRCGRKIYANHPKEIMCEYCEFEQKKIGTLKINQ